MTSVSKPRNGDAAGLGPARLCLSVGVLTLALALAGCASTLESLPPALGGLPDGTPEAPAARTEYPGVFKTPPPRSNTVLTDDELKKTEADLTAARDRQNKQAEDAKPK
jgi:hypothetical protein